MKTFVIVGIGFGDEGKGITTDFLSLHYPSPTLVVRFNGGHQAGHTVCTENGRRHVFSNFGSGTLRGASTYWSKFCTIDPPAIAKEYALLNSKIEDGPPALFIDKLCPVATPYDKSANRSEEVVNKHGSCGVGFGSTIKRHTESPVKLFAQDLSFPYIVEQKLKSIRDWYGVTKNEFAEMNFKSSLKEFNKIATLVIEKEIFSKHFSSVIFEGAQGIMLDMDFGFFPNVTRSHTTSKNAIEIIRRNNLPTPDIFYVTRGYQTRHGAGPMSNEEQSIELANNEDETNKTNAWQGDFRTGRLDLELLRYAISCDNNFSFGCPKNLVITCLDQLLDGNVLFTDKGGQFFSTDCIPAVGSAICEEATLYASFSPISERFNKYPIKMKA